jgi:hypothetical protein
MMVKGALLHYLVHPFNHARCLMRTMVIDVNPLFLIPWGLTEYLYNGNLVRCAHNWNDGMVEYWNNGMAPFGQIYAYGGDLEGRWCCRHFPEKGKKGLIIPYQHDKIPLIGELFHHSIIPSFLVGICRMVDWIFPIINNL